MSSEMEKPVNEENKTETPQDTESTSAIPETTPEASGEDKKDVSEAAHDTVPAKTVPENSIQTEEEDPEENDFSEEDSTHQLSLTETLNEMEAIINKADAGSRFKKFNILKNKAAELIADETEDAKQQFLGEGGAEEDFAYDHPLANRYSGLLNIFREKQDAYHQEQNQEQENNLQDRKQIIEDLKNLYTNADPGVNLFKAIRDIKERWSNSGLVPKSEFKLLNNDYFYHLNQFYAMLDLNKEYLEQEYSHNLEKRYHIIERAKELQNEPLVQKALNELQFLHKMWKEEAEPVAEEFRDKTWEEFKEISNKIHDRKAELFAELEAEQKKNLELKNAIIEEIKKLISPESAPSHSYWQQAIKKVEALRAEFLKAGSVPRKLSNQNWMEFKQTLRAFNSTKNDFYKSLKNDQVKNLEAKQKLIQTAKDNMESEDWETMVPLFKKLQDEWKNIGHVPRSQANKIWDAFREACNHFFNNFRDKNAAAGDNWKENYKAKRQILDQLIEVTDEEGSIEKIEELKNAWNAVGKVPRDKLTINKEFNQVLREKLKLNKINEFDLKEEGLSETQLTDKARKIKGQISDLEAEIAKLENNINFFSKPTRDNPLLRDTYSNLDSKKEQLENLKQSLHTIIAGE